LHVLPVRSNLNIYNVRKLWVKVAIWPKVEQMRYFIGRIIDRIKVFIGVKKRR
jgi:hypothetical protein